jgi:hypothetical protein
MQAAKPRAAVPPVLTGVAMSPHLRRLSRLVKQLPKQQEAAVPGGSLMPVVVAADAAAAAAAAAREPHDHTLLSLADMRDIWSDDLLTSVMPFWCTHSPDEEFGGYFTCLDRQGQVYDDRKYMWLQGRAVYTFSRMFIEFGGEVDQATRMEYLRLAKLGAEFLSKGRGSDGINDNLLFFALSRDGQYKLHLQRKPYSAVFFIQGCLEYYRALRTLENELGTTDHGEDKESYLATALEFYDLLGEWLVNPQLSGRPKVETPPSDGVTALGDVMCMASLALDFLEKLPWDQGHPLATVSCALVSRV